ncbi:DUF7670 domain-containing protein [Helicovermis profundi]|uniref:DUF7670 domain-containing protein n=1 Tax=Helicovermis profundi TaxID=3065157 RepID=A0AAU9E0I8_9FIRM|nr:hypothetical protein HLPR_03820 [Clostridia bacterium S502]
MTKTKYTAIKVTNLIRWTARILATVIITLALFMVIASIWNYLTTGKADPYAIENYPAIENLIPITLGLSIVGLGIAWRWEGIGGTITLVFQVLTFAVHHWLLTPRPYPYPLTIIISATGILFIVCWWLTRKRIISENSV